MNIPSLSDYDFSITGKKVEDNAVTYEGSTYAKVVQPGTVVPEVVQTVGELGPAICIPPPDGGEPHPAAPGSWPPSPEDIRGQEAIGLMKVWSPQLWSKVKAAPKPSKTPEIF
jgi:hypothetical protein